MINRAQYSREVGVISNNQGTRERQGKELSLGDKPEPSIFSGSTWYFWSFEKGFWISFWFNLLVISSGSEEFIFEQMTNPIHLRLSCRGHCTLSKTWERFLMGKYFEKREELLVQKERCHHSEEVASTSHRPPFVARQIWSLTLALLSFSSSPFNCESERVDDDQLLVRLTDWVCEGRAAVGISYKSRAITPPTNPHTGQMAKFVFSGCACYRNDFVKMISRNGD